MAGDGVAAWPATLIYLPGIVPPYVLGSPSDIGFGAMMISYSIIKEVNPDEVKGSTTGAIDVLVFPSGALPGRPETARHSLIMKARS
jgi:hypothetical protein